MVIRDVVLQKSPKLCLLKAYRGLAVSLYPEIEDSIVAFETADEINEVCSFAQNLMYSVHQGMPVYLWITFIGVY